MLGHHVDDQMWDIAELREVDAFQVADQQPDVVRRLTQQEAGDYRADQDALTRTRLSGNQQVRHCRQVEDDRRAGDITADREVQLRSNVPELRRLRDIAQRHEAHSDIGHLDPDDALTWDRGLDTQSPRSKRESNVVVQRLNAGELHARRWLEFVASYDWADSRFDDGGPDTEVRERFLDYAAAALNVREAPTMATITGTQQVDRREFPLNVCLRE